MQMKYISKYNTFLDTLRSIGIDPLVLETNEIIDSVTRNNNEYDFNTKNIIPGPFGEIIKINYETNYIEIYSLQDYYYSKKVIDLSDGSLKLEEIGKTNPLKDITYFGYYLYNELLDIEEKDYSAVRRTIFNDKMKYSIKKLDDKNSKIREELPILKESITRYLSDFYAHDGVRRIIDKVDDAYNFRSNYKYFDSDELSGDTLWVINRKLRLDFLENEKVKFNSIDAFPLYDLIEEYSKYGKEKEDKIAFRINSITNKVYEKIDSFYKAKGEIQNKQCFYDGEIKSIKRHTLMFIRRTKELKEKEYK